MIKRKYIVGLRIVTFPKNGQDKSGSGIGLVNLEKRLELIYPESYSFRHGQEGDTYIADLQIQTGVK